MFTTSVEPLAPTIFSYFYTNLPHFPPIVIPLCPPLPNERWLMFPVVLQWRNTHTPLRFASTRVRLARTLVPQECRLPPE